MFLNTIIESINVIIVYDKNTITFEIEIISKLLFSMPFIIFKQLSKGNNSQTFAKKPPTSSLGKYIPLVKHASCTTILPTPPVAFSLTKLPINIPMEINKIEIIIEINIVYIIFILKLNPNKHAVIIN